MNPRRHSRSCLPVWLRRALTAAALAVAVVGCGRSDTEAEVPVPRTPKEAATVVHDAFEPAPAEVKDVAAEASEALRAADYEKAVVSLVALRESKSLNVNQGIAIHHSMVALESQLIQAMEAGDPSAKQAYQTLRRLKRN